MKKILSIAALSLLSLSSLFTAPAQAVGTSTAAGNFDVGVTLTPKCEITTPSAMTISYTSFQTGPSTGTSTANVRCTNTLGYELTLDTATAVTDTDTNLDYTLSLSAATGTGTGINQLVTVTGTMASGQSGTCATASCTNTSSTNKQHTLTVTY